MFNKLFPIALLPLAFSAPAKRSSGTLNCVQFQYGGPFTSFGSGGFIHLYSNVTSFDSSTQHTDYNETRLGLAEDGTIENCGECRTTELFGFEVCQNDQRKGFDGLGNEPSGFYGHVTYTNVSPDIQCLTATKSPYEGASLKLADCQYDYDSAATSGQYFEMTVTDGVYHAHLIDEGSNFYGPTPELNNNASLVLYNVVGPNTTFTSFGFKAPEF
ncbi:hypothetical protein C365_03475 [Cryptococcus neoformans Bt85]|nr:hypothetical protein C365_03475 [Cryptococcus neoformans var. grubii Bt85]OXM78808.1 hypothetical protein C364_03281 [Cryptococcus neoformans var. grubii Bt63]